MKPFAIAWTLVFLAGTLSLAQESADAGREARETERQEPRRGRRERRTYDQDKFPVKDPDSFQAEGEPVFSGPQPGEKVSGFQAAIISGEEKGKEVDPVALAGTKPQILFFQDESGVAIRGLFGVVRAIRKIEQKTEQDLHVACVFLSDDPDAITTRFGQVFPRLREQGIDLVVAAKEGRDGPGVYGLNRTVAQTILLTKGGKVTRNFVFRQGMLYANPHVMGGIAELIEEDVDTVAGWLGEADEESARMKMRRDNDSQSSAKAALREKLGEFMRAGKLSRKEAGELYQAAFPERR